MNRVIRARDLDAIYVTGPGHGGPGIVANTYLEGTYSEVYPHITPGRGGHAPPLPPVLLPRRHPEPRRARDARLDPRGRRARLLARARLRRGVRQPRPAGRAASSATARRRPGRSPRAGTRTSSSTPRATARCCRSCTSTATRSPTRRCSRASREDELRALLRGLRARAATSSRATTRRRCTRRWRRRSTTALDEIARDPARVRATDGHDASGPRWPMIVLRTPKGWTGPKEVDGKPVEGTFRAHQVPLAGLRATTPSTCGSSRSGCGATGPRSSSTSDGALRRRARRARARRASGAWAPTRTPTAGCCCATSSCPTSATTRSTCRAPAARPARRRACSATSCATSMRAQRRQLPVFGPDETASNRLGAVFEVTDRAWDGRRRMPTDDHLAPDGRVMEMLSEHLCQGWLEGYLLTGRHGLFNCYEAFIHIVDSMFNQHAKWLKVTRHDPVAAPDRLAQLPAQLARLAPGPQRLLAPGPGLHRPRRQQEGRGRPRLPAAGRQLPAVGGRPLPAQPRLRQRHRRRQAAGARLPDDGRGDRALHARHRHLGVGEQRRRRRARRRAGLRRRRADAGDARRGGAAARAPARSEGPRRQRRRPDAAAAGRSEHPHGLLGPRVRRALHRPTGR